MVGVDAPGYPYEPTWSARSVSIVTSSTFGRTAGVAGASAARQALMSVRTPKTQKLENRIADLLSKPITLQKAVDSGQCKGGHSTLYEH
jgi:hypothetical protein